MKETRDEICFERVVSHANDAHVPVVCDKMCPAKHVMATLAEAHVAAPGEHETHVPAVDLYCVDEQVVAETKPNSP